MTRTVAYPWPETTYLDVRAAEWLQGAGRIRPLLSAAAPRRCAPGSCPMRSSQYGPGCGQPTDGAQANPATRRFPVSGQVRSVADAAGRWGRLR